MSTQTLGVILLLTAFAAAVPYVLFTLHYGLTAPWWRTTSGRALMVSTPAVALLILAELYFEFFPVSPRAEMTAGLVLFGLVFVGGMLKYGSFLHERRRGRHRKP